MVRRRSDDSGAVDRSRLLDVLDRVLDGGIVVDAWARVSLVGIDLVTVEARVVVASIGTYLNYAEAVRTSPRGLRSAQRPTAREPTEEGADPAAGLPESEAVVRAVEAYLRQLRQGGQPEG